MRWIALSLIAVAVSLAACGGDSTETPQATFAQSLEGLRTAEERARAHLRDTIIETCQGSHPAQRAVAREVLDQGFRPPANLEDTTSAARHLVLHPLSGVAAKQVHTQPRSEPPRV